MVVKIFFSCRREGGGNRGIVGVNDKGSGRGLQGILYWTYEERRMGGDADFLLKEFQNRHQIKVGREVAGEVQLVHAWQKVWLNLAQNEM